MSTQSAHGSYERFTQAIEDAMGTDETTLSTQLDQVGQLLFGKKFLGTYPRDQIPISTMEPGDMVILNTHEAKQPGQHWIPMGRGVKRPNCYYYHDSFAKFRLQFGQGVKGSGRKRLIAADERDVEQTTRETNCGQRALAWLMVFHHSGEDHAVKI